MHTLEQRLNNSLLQQIRTILVNVPRIREGDPDAIHDARVATRRIRAVRSVTRGLSPKGTYEVFRAMIRRLRRELGLVRDLDMILDVVNATERGN